MIAAIYTRKPTDQSGVSDDQSRSRDNSTTRGSMRRERDSSGDEQPEATRAVSRADHVGGVETWKESDRNGLFIERPSRGPRC
jgi:hypothetical protein